MYEQNVEQKISVDTYILLSFKLNSVGTKPIMHCRFRNDSLGGPAVRPGDDIPKLS